ncbi:MAG TPA: hypothetical protein VK145_03250 [Candidatus Nanoarchaeia archaeon]|nr:hypothetical protein [Candidatus Nanoarchaeia archaeon]
MKYVKEALGGAAILTLVIAMMFTLVEPGLSFAIEDQFTISQTVTSEISFATTATDVTMSPSLGGITGGTSNGTTTVVVLTNDSSGYTMTIKASTSPAMDGETTTGTIADYTPVAAGVPDFTYSVPSSAEFGYTVLASTTSDLAQKFKDDGASTCNTGSADTSGAASCWYGLSTVATSTIFRTTATSASGSTSSVVFKLTINSGSFVPEDTYKATTTLTATTN